MKLPSARTLARSLTETHPPPFASKGRGLQWLAHHRLRRFANSSPVAATRTKTTGRALLSRRRAISRAERGSPGVTWPISVPTALCQASEQGHSLATEIKVLIPSRPAPSRRFTTTNSRRTANGPPQSAGSAPASACRRGLIETHKSRTGPQKSPHKCPVAPSFRALCERVGKSRTQTRKRGLKQ